MLTQKVIWTEKLMTLTYWDCANFHEQFSTKNIIFQNITTEIVHNKTIQGL